eukprot:CAMPEP_0174254540 /NCGR_PEP_ID=MMETSP0439-20130205/3853_1 /TAXON_ID=0 /ORGANISM="Stereomyxa ramosa, Strain Chinc5" /LENGTH=787 /DNA_ID=CAMNT_0015336175 /DNA_START=45 /DNA_END=2408 /DNA_ORIENTATION=+
MGREERLSLREEVREMFFHAYDSYMEYAFPADELKPIRCEGRYRQPPTSKQHRGDLDLVLGGFSMTLVDSLDTLAMMGNYTEFEKGVQLVLEEVSFDSDVVVSVFETTIRVLGGLLSAHVISETYRPGNQISHEGKTLLDLAIDLGNRLLPAFSTPTGIPYQHVNLRHGVPKTVPHVTCLAGAGTLLLEFGTLSRLSGDPIYWNVASRTVRELWDLRAKHTNLFGGDVNVIKGKWMGEKRAGIGAGRDSFYEYLLKAYISFGEEEFMHMFNVSYNAIKKFVKQGDWFLDVNMNTGHNLGHNIDSLQSFWPALQVLRGDVSDAIEMHSTFYAVWQRYGYLPENFNVRKRSVTSTYRGYPLRPELVESTFLLHRATNDPYYLEVGKQIMKNLQKTKVKCGFAAVADVHTGRLEDRMDSFFLSETCKYLYLLFDPHNEFASSENFVFTTEGHLAPIFHSNVWPAVETPKTEHTHKQTGKKEEEFCFDEEDLYCPWIPEFEESWKAEIHQSSRYSDEFFGSNNHFATEPQYLTGDAAQVILEKLGNPAEGMFAGSVKMRYIAFHVYDDEDDIDTEEGDEELEVVAEVVPSAFGKPFDFLMEDMTALPVVILESTGCVASEITQSAEIVQSVVLISRGGCAFITKIENVARYNPAAVLIYNNVDGDLFVMSQAEHSTGAERLPPNGLISKGAGEYLIAESLKLKDSYLRISFFVYQQEVSYDSPEMRALIFSLLQGQEPDTSDLALSSLPVFNFASGPSSPNFITITSNAPMPPSAPSIPPSQPSPSSSPSP